MGWLVQKGLNSLAARFGYRLSKNGDIDVLQPLLARQIRKGRPFFFVQIGGNDGKSSDPIYNFVTRHGKQVRGIVLEPMKDVFEELAYNYRHCPGVKCLNTAIHNTAEEMLLYRVDPAKADGLPAWSKGIASFDPDHHKRSGIASECIIAEPVPCIPFARLVDDYAIEKIDLLQIDTEGYDCEILFGMDFDRIRPGIIHFEHGLGENIMDRSMFRRVSDLLHEHDYQVSVEQYDATAYQLDVIFDQ